MNMVLLANIAESDMFENLNDFVGILWSEYPWKLSKENLKIIFRDEYKLDGFVPKLNELIKFADIMRKRIRNITFKRTGLKN